MTTSASERSGGPAAAPPPTRGAAARNLAYESARVTQRRIVAEWSPDDYHPTGRRIELAADLEAGSVFDFLNRHGAALAGAEVMPTDAVADWLRLLFNDQLPDILEALTWQETLTLARDVWVIYMAQHAAQVAGLQTRPGGSGPKFGEIVGLWDTIRADFRRHYSIEYPDHLPLSTFRAYLGNLPADSAFWRRWWQETDDPAIVLDRAFGPLKRGETILNPDSM